MRPLNFFLNKTVYFPRPTFAQICHYYMLELAPSILMSVISVLSQKYAYILAFSSSKDKGLNKLEASL